MQIGFWLLMAVFGLWLVFHAAGCTWAANGEADTLEENIRVNQHIGDDL